MSGDEGKGPLLVIAAGGTGGHMFPAQAFAEEMLARGWRVALASDARGLNYAGGFPAAVARRELKAASFARGGAAAKLAAPFQILGGVLDARRWLKQEKPALVAGFGGYPSLPAVGAAILTGVPRMLHEQNAILGRVNRLFAKRADLVALGTPLAAPAPKGTRAELVGNPLRAAALERLGAPYGAPAPGAPFNLLVFGGSQGARIFGSLIPAALARLPQDLRGRIRLTQQIPPSDAEAEAALKLTGVAYEAAPFFADLPRRIAEAHLVIARAGASSLAELAAIGRPSVLIPLPEAMADHQSFNARIFAAAGAAIHAPQKDLSAESLAAILADLAADPRRLGDMAMAARGLGRPEAARRLADLAEGLARRA